MSRATVRVVDVLVGEMRIQRITVDCAHATTTGDVLNRQAEQDVVRVLAARHAETCRCAAYLLEPGVRA